MSAAEQLNLGVIVCCRDEARVIERRLWNLARAQWPAARRAHIVLVVDDGSRDGTAKLAAATAGEGLFPSEVKFELIENHARPGKSGAIASALAELRSRVDLFVLTDADVVNDPRALVELAGAFEREPELGLACGAQSFVRAMPWDGTIDGTVMRSFDTAYDRVTAWVRALESVNGRVFSVHGQLLAWRADLELSPRLGLAADDLELMRLAHERGKRIEVVAAARFFELRPWTSELRRAQALRRARAYFQFMRTVELADLRDRGARLQWSFYKYAPPLAPWIGMSAVLLVAIAGPAWIWSIGPASSSGLGGLSSAIALWLIFAQWIGRRMWRFLGVIEEARQLERSDSLDDQWSTAR